MTKVIRAISSVPTTTTARKYPALSLSRSPGAALTDADSLLAFMSFPKSMQGVLISARNAPKPENAAVAAFTFQRGNGSVVLLVAAAGTIIFVELRRARCRRCGDCCVRCSKQVRRPVKEWQRSHRSYPFKVVTEPLWRAIPLTQTATFLFRPDKRLGRGAADRVPCATSGYVSPASFSASVQSTAISQTPVPGENPVEDFAEVSFRPEMRRPRSQSYEARWSEH
jgi:hypothetical protein